MAIRCWFCREVINVGNRKIENLLFENMQYVIEYPEKYVKGKRFPIIVFLHGAGTRGNDINVLRNNPYFQITGKYVDFPFMTVAPLCSCDTWFDMFETLERFIRKIIEEEYADKKRIYLMGASMGGYATWQLAMSMPELFAAIVPICGGGMYWNAARLVNVPVWAFHGKKDPIVFVEESEKMVAAINQNGGDARLTIYPNNGHDAWSDTYSNPEVYKWLLTKENSNIAEITNIYSDSMVYG